MTSCSEFRRALFSRLITAVLNLIYSKVREWAGLTGSETVLDLYCGIGGIALFLARQAKQMIGVEVVEDAVADAA